MNDPYSVLGVNPDASDDEIKRVYRELARKYTRTTIRIIPWQTWPRRR